MPPTLQVVEFSRPEGTPSTDLGEFEGKPIEDIPIKVTKAGDGLSKTMKVEPVLMEQDTYCYILMRTRIAQVIFRDHNYAKGEANIGGLDRVQVLEAEGAIVLPLDTPGASQVEAMMLRIKEQEKAKRDARRGQQTIPGMTDDGSEDGKSESDETVPGFE